ncbi:hypothetical protein B0H14DRAFT_2599803 [Mycena olivaceomarginata]|nr:hypothetical protein B0H14DRAFT_2599803 [Mycena olivaceomarginata]
MPQQSCLELPVTICVLRTPTAMLSAHIHTIESGCKRLARRIRSTWEARALRQVVVSILDTDLRREQLFLLLAVGCSELHPPQVREGYISRRAAAFDGENQIHLNFRGVGDWRLVPWGLSEVNMKAERDRMLSGKGMFWGPWGWTQVYPWFLALSSQPVPGPANIPDAVLQPNQNSIGYIRGTASGNNQLATAIYGVLLYGLSAQRFTPDVTLCHLATIILAHIPSPSSTPTSKQKISSWTHVAGGRTTDQQLELLLHQDPQASQQRDRWHPID